MKKTTLFIFTILFTINFAHAGVGRKAWLKADDKGKAEIIKIYKEWFLAASKKENVSEWDLKKTTMFNLFSEAWAADGMNCIYAGWPSIRAGSCSSPARSNPDYQQGTCSNSEMQCQPMLFGEGLCVSTATQDSRSSAFSNCNKLFQTSGRTSASVVAEIKAKNQDAQLLSLLDFADGICRSGEQAQTGMCSRLKTRLDSVRTELEKAVTVIARVPQALDNVNAISAPCAGSTTIPEVRVDTPVLDEVAVNIPLSPPPPPELNESNITPYLSDRARENLCTGQSYVRSQDGRDSGFRTVNTFQCVGPENRLPAGISIEGADHHSIDFYAQDGSKSGSYIYLQEAVLPNDSHNVKSMMFLLPRRGIPGAVVVGEEIHVTLQTGEIVIYDRNTKQIKSGALLEGPSDQSTDRFTRKPPNIQYTGSGISIRVDHRYEHPTSSAGDPTAEVKQNGRTCSVPRARLWNAEGEILETDDAAIVRVINQVCPARAGQRPFSI